MNHCAAKLNISPLGSRMTNQRQLILDYLRCVTSHPTAKQIYTEVKKKLPHISVGTVYRNLELLVKNNHVLALKSVNGCVHYDGNASQHSHLICEICAKVFDIEGDYHTNLLAKMNKKCEMGDISSCRVNFYGICKNCKKKNISKK